jgi:4-amino-4-deoxy-L-arabinose transferase
MDLLFALLCALALDRLVALSSAPSRRDHLLLWLWIALAVLTKGPLGIALPLLAAAAVLPVDRAPLSRAVVGWGPLLALTIVGAWLAPAAVQAGGAWLETLAVHQTTGRMVASFAHREPWWYHLATVPLSLLPWSLPVLFGSVVAFTQFRGLPRQARVVAAYPVVGVVLLSLLSGKTLLYPLPLFAPACIVAAWWLLRHPNGAAQRAALGAAGLVMLTLGAALSVLVTRRPDLLLAPSAAAVVGLSLAAPACVAVLGAVRGRPAVALTGLATAVALFVAVGMQPMIAPFDRLLSLRPFGEALAATDTRPEEPGIVYDKLQPGFLLFTGRRFQVVTGPQELDRVLDQGRVVAINVKAEERLRQNGRGGWHTVADVPYRHTRILLIARPQSDPDSDPDSDPGPAPGR